jgi:hypothetical protein
MPNGQWRLSRVHCPFAVRGPVPPPSPRRFAARAAAQCVIVPKVTVSPAQANDCHWTSLPVWVAATMSSPPS